MTMGFAPRAVTEVISAGEVSEDDVRRLRSEVWSDGRVAANEVEWMFRIEESCVATDDAWPRLFVEAVTDALVHEVEPTGYVDEREADWLIKRISRDGVIGTQTELELLVKIMELAREVPDQLRAFALAQVKGAVLTGKGPLARHGNLTPGVIGEAEVELLRRILYAAAGDGSMMVTKAEAEVLFDLNDQTAEADNHPAWSDLFVRCMANHILAHSGYTPPSREEALRRSAWLDERSDGLLSSLGTFGRNVLKGGLRASKSYYGVNGAYGERLASDTAARATTEQVTACEADWLLERIGRDRKLHENERALIEFLAEEAITMDRRLTNLLAA